MASNDEKNRAKQKAKQAKQAQLEAQQKMKQAKKAKGEQPPQLPTPPPPPPPTPPPPTARPTRPATPAQFALGPNSKKGKRSSRGAPRRKTRAAKKQSQRIVYVIFGILLVIISISAFIYIQNRAEVSTTQVLLANRALIKGDEVVLSDFNVGSIPSDSPLLSSLLTPEEFRSFPAGAPVAVENIPVDTIINKGLIIAGAVNQENVKVEFSIFVPTQGFPSGPPVVNSRVALIAYIPERGNPFYPLLVETVLGVSGNRIAFRTTIDRATLLQQAQLQTTAQGGYLIIWNAPPGLNENEVLNQAQSGFANPVL